MKKEESGREMRGTADCGETNRNNAKRWKQWDGQRDNGYKEVD